MSDITGTNSRNGIPLYLRFRYGGTDIAWKQPVKINSFSNSGESVDGKYRISDLDVQFADINGSYFATQFGNGTSGFGSSLEVIAYLGGTMGYQASTDYVTMYKSLGTAGGYAATLHTGKVYGVSYSNRMLRIRSKTNLALVNDLKWQFPVSRLSNYYAATTVYGSTFFSSGNLATGYLGTTAFYNFSNADTKWDAKGYNFNTADLNFTDLDTLYPAMAGRGTAIVDGTFFWAGTDAGGTNFYDVFSHMSIKGTYFGTYTGTITTDAEANVFGYKNRAEADTATAPGFYYVNRTAIQFGTTPNGPYINFIAPMRITGSPKDCYQLLMTGAMVSPFFTTSDLDTNTLATTAVVTAYSFYDNTIAFSEIKAFDALKSIIETCQGLFSVNSSNKFQFDSYGPKNLLQTIPSLGTGDIISSSFENLEETYYNRFIVKYQYDYLNDNYNAQAESKVSSWSRVADKPLTIESKWIKRPNEASVLAQRLALRYEYTIPHITFTTTLNKLGIDIGSLIQITDVNSGLNAKTVQVTGFQKDWTNKTISFDSIDGVTLYQRKGFAFWGTTGTLPGDAISNSSISGWGTLGIVPNINGTLYGSQFSWF